MSAYNGNTADILPYKGESLVFEHTDVQNVAKLGESVTHQLICITEASIPLTLQNKQQRTTHQTVINHRKNSYPLMDTSRLLWLNFMNDSVKLTKMLQKYKTMVHQEVEKLIANICRFMQVLSQPP